jgi:uncharacterized protein
MTALLDDWVCTLSGRKFRPLDPQPEDIVARDIAHGLAGRFRFGGQSAIRYTVAQHSVEVAGRVPAADRLWGLLHDAAEAWLPDVQRPLKPHLLYRVPSDEGLHVRTFGGLEDRILQAVAARFGLHMPIPTSVHTADDRELARERRDLFGPTQPEWPGLAGIEPYPEPLLAWTPEVAEREWLRTFKALTKGGPVEDVLDK